MRRRLALLGIVIGVGLIALVPPAQSGTLSCFGKAATKVGTDTNDFITGTENADVIVAKGGDDIVDGRGGDDRICGNDGDDSLDAGLGNDKVSGGPGTGTKFQNLSGDSGTSQAGGGNDLVVGDDTARDSIIGSDGNDVLKGLGGEDSLRGDAGRDTIAAGTGNDELFAADAEKDVVNGGDGTDNCAFDPGIDRVRKCP